MTDKTSFPLKRSDCSGAKFVGKWVYWSYVASNCREKTGFPFKRSIPFPDWAPNLQENEYIEGMMLLITEKKPVTLSNIQFRRPSFIKLIKIFYSTYRDRLSWWCKLESYWIRLAYQTFISYRCSGSIRNQFNEMRFVEKVCKTLNLYAFLGAILAGASVLYRVYLHRVFYLNLYKNLRTK